MAIFESSGRTRQSRRTSFVAETFVTTAFMVMGLAFWAETAALIWFYRDAPWFEILTFDAHSFIFFPTLGCVALFFFRQPAALALTVMWNRRTFDRIVTVVLIAGIAGASVFLMAMFEGILSGNGPNPSLWHIKWEKLEEEHCARPGANCDDPGSIYGTNGVFLRRYDEDVERAALAAGEQPPVPIFCRLPTLRYGGADGRGPTTPISQISEPQSILCAHYGVRLVARTSEGLRGVVDACSNENLSITQTDDDRPAFCFASLTQTEPNDPRQTRACCQAKRELERRKRCLLRGYTVDEPRNFDCRAFLNDKNQSDLFDIHRWLMPFKIFFLLFLLTVGVMLLRFRADLDRDYSEELDICERDVPVGVLCMLAWPLLNEGYTNSLNLLSGVRPVGSFSSTAPIYSMVFAGWALALIYFSIRRLDIFANNPNNPQKNRFDLLMRVFGFIIPIAGVASYERLVDITYRYIGAGADTVSLVVSGLLLATLGYAIFSHGVRKEGANDLIDEPEPPPDDEDEADSLGRRRIDRGFS